MSSDQQLRAAIREALDQFIDPDDGTMPYCNRVDGGYTWTPADAVIDRLVHAVLQAPDGKEST